MNQLKSFPSGLLKLDRLRYLSLRNNNIPSIPDGISKMVSLEVLILSENPLGSKFDLGKGINRLLLDHLDLSGCGLDSISPTLGDLKSLKSLDLSNNALTFLPDSVGQLQNLQNLSLAFNQLNSLPLSVGLLRKLTALELADNPWNDDADIQEALAYRPPEKDDSLSSGSCSCSSSSPSSSSSSSYASSSYAAPSPSFSSSSPLPPRSTSPNPLAMGSSEPPSAGTETVSFSEDDRTERERTKIETSACQRVQLLQRQRMRRDPALRLLLFEEKEHKSNIEIRFKVKGDPNSGSDIVQSTPEKLVLYLTRYQPPEKGFFKTVHLTWTYWTDTIDLLDLLQVRFNAAADNDASNANPVNNVIRLRTLNFFRKWLEGLVETFVVVSNPAEMQKIEQTIELLGTAGQSIKDSCVSLVEQLKGNASRLSELNEEYQRQQSELHAAQSRSSLAVTSSFLLETAPRAIAEHEVIIEYEMWKAIPINEFLHQSWTKTKETPPPSRHLLALINRFNCISSWVATELVKVTKDKKLRVRILGHLILIAQECLNVCNYNALFAIMSGFATASVSRLKETWAALPDKIRDVYVRLQSVIDSNGNFANYRKLVSGELTICLPYVGRMLQDLTFIEDGNPNIIPGTDLINFHKFLMIGDQLQQIETMQQNCPLKPEDYKEDPQVRDYLLHLQTFGEQELYHASLMCEASNRRRTVSSAVILDLRNNATRDAVGRRLSDSPPVSGLALSNVAEDSESPRSRSATVDTSSSTRQSLPNQAPLAAVVAATDPSLFRSSSTSSLAEE